MLQVFPSKYNREIKYVKMEVEILLMEIIESRKYCVEMGRSNFYGNDLLGILLDEIKKEGGTLNLQLVIWMNAKHFSLLDMKPLHSCSLGQLCCQQAIHIGKTKSELKSKRSSRGKLHQLINTPSSLWLVYLKLQ